MNCSGSRKTRPVVSSGDIKLAICQIDSAIKDAFCNSSHALLLAREEILGLLTKNLPIRNTAFLKEVKLIFSKEIDNLCQQISRLGNENKKSNQGLVKEDGDRYKKNVVNAIKNLITAVKLFETQVKLMVRSVSAPFPPYDDTLVNHLTSVSNGYLSLLQGYLGGAPGVIENIALDTISRIKYAYKDVSQVYCAIIQERLKAINGAILELLHIKRCENRLNIEKELCCIFERLCHNCKKIENCLFEVIHNAFLIQDRTTIRNTVEQPDCISRLARNRKL